MQVRGEVAQALADGLVTTQQPVVAHDRRHGDREAEGRHDQSFTDGAGHLVDGRLPLTPMDTRAFRMPHTVPNRPTNGAVEPTVARNARPLLILLFTESTERCSDMVTHSCRSMRSVRRPSWWADARRPSSATARKSLSF